MDAYAGRNGGRCRALTGGACVKPPRGPCACQFSEGDKAAISARVKAAMATDAVRAKISAGTRAAMATEDVKDKVSRGQYRRHGNGTWPPERDAELTRLWSAGLSGGEIGMRLHCSRNAVIGRAHRIGLPKRRIQTSRPIRRSDDRRTDRTAPALAHADIIRRLAAAGASDREIGDEIGMSRKQIGHARALLGVKPGAVQKRDRIQTRAARPATRDETTPMMARFAEGYEGQTGRVDLLGLADGVCHFPIDQQDGPVRYCGDHAEDGGRYCPHHAGRMFQPMSLARVHA